MDIVSVIKRYGKTSKEVADALNTSPGYISQLGSGKTAPSIKKLDELAAVIGCHRWEFFIDEMDREAVATAFGLAEPQAKPAPEQPQAEQTAAPDLQETEKAPSVVTQGALICPHCGKPFTVEVRG